MPELDQPYRLDPDAPARFARDGFVRLPGVLSPAAIARHEPEITRLVLELNLARLPLSERSTYERAFLQVTNLWQDSEQVRRLVWSTRLARIAAELMGVDGVRLYHDQALYKEPGGGITPWHADQFYWPFVGDQRTCTAWVPLQDTPAQLGPLEFAVGSHRFEFGRDLPIGDESEAALQHALAGQGFPVSVEPYPAGTVSYHQGWTFHRASPNRGSVPRRVMTIIYLDADLTVAEPVNQHQRGDLAGWLPGAAPGELPDTPINPVLYRR